MAEFSSAVHPGLGLGRVLPTTGLTLHQISDVLGAFGLPPLYYEVATLKDADRPREWPDKHTGLPGRIARLCCRYMNSGLPVLVVMRQLLENKATQGLHAIVACGYERMPNIPGGVHFVIHDDRRGPYLTVMDTQKDPDPQSGSAFRWEQVLAPVPEKLWTSGEAAERTGCEHLLEAASHAANHGVEDCTRLIDLHTEHRLTVRTYATTSNRFKERIRQRCVDPVVIREYAYARFPRYIWVVEVIDRQLRSEGGPAVLGEVIIDATSDDLAPIILATRLPGVISIPHPDDPDFDARTGAEPLESGGQFAP